MASNTAKNAAPELTHTEFFDKYFDLSERRSAFRQNHMYSAELEIVGACDLTCRYCYNPSEHRFEKPMDLAFAKDVLRGLSDAGVRRVMYEGGEPLLHPQITEMLEFAGGLGLKNQIITNGYRLSPTMAGHLVPHLDAVSVHLDTIDVQAFADVQHFDDPKRAALCHQRCLDGILHLLDAGLDPADVELNIVLSKPVLSTFQRTMEWAIDEMGFGMVVLLPYHPVGQGATLPLGDWLPSPEEIDEAFRIRAEMIRPELRSLGTMDLCKYYCLTNFYIDIKGNVLACSFVTQKFGNIYKRDIRDILLKEYRLLSFSDCVDADGNNTVSGPCKTCEHNDICFGCRANANLLLSEVPERDRLFASDPLCWHVWQRGTSS